MEVAYLDWAKRILRSEFYPNQIAWENGETASDFINYSYDFIGNLNEVSDLNSRLSYTYDRLGREIGENAFQFSSESF